MPSFLTSTPGGKAGTIDGLNLFFGALLGANLGTMQGMAIADYAKLVVLLAGTVAALRMVSTSERRLPMLLTLGLYFLIIVTMLLTPRLQPKGMALADFQRLAVTLCIWMMFVVVSELAPVRQVAAADKTPA